MDDQITNLSAKQREQTEDLSDFSFEPTGLDPESHTLQADMSITLRRWTADTEVTLLVTQSGRITEQPMSGSGGVFTTPVSLPVEDTGEVSFAANITAGGQTSREEVTSYSDLAMLLPLTNDGSGYGITSSDYWNERYNGKLITEFEADKSYTYGVYFKISDLGMEEGYRFDQNTKLYINGEEITLTPDQIDVDDSGETIWFSNVLTMTPSTVKVIDVVEINDVTINFKNGDKPVFTGKSPEGVKYAYNCEWWELDSKTGAISADFFSGAYENKITTFESGKTYHYGVYVKAVGFVESENTSYIFGPDTKLKINGEFVNYKRYENDTSDGSDGTLWVITDLTMTPKANDTSSDSSDTNSDSKDTSSNNSTNTNSNSNTDSKTPTKNNAGSTNPNTGNNVSGILLTFVIAGSGLVVAGRRSRKNK